jgi:hypothetical protein
VKKWITLVADPGVAGPIPPPAATMEQAALRTVNGRFVAVYSHGATFSRAWKLAADVLVSHIVLGFRRGLMTQN